MNSDAFVPEFGDLIFVPAHRLRERLASRRDLIATRAIHKRLHLPRPDPPKRYGHVMFVYDVFEPINDERIIILAEFGENGCRIFWADSGAGPYDVYHWCRPQPLACDGRAYQESWWRHHQGDEYGYLSYPRMWLRGILGSGDWSKAKLTGTGLMCSTSIALVNWLVAQYFYAKPRLHWSIMSPHMLAASPRVELVAANWRIP